MIIEERQGDDLVFIYDDRRYQGKRLELLRFNGITGEVTFGEVEIEINGPVTGLPGGGGSVNSVSGTAPIASTGGADPVISLNDGGVTHAKLANIPTNTLMGRSSAGTGPVQDITLTAAGRDLLDDPNAAAQRTTLGLGGAAVLNVGTSAGTVAAGDHTHANATGSTAGFMSATDKTNLDLVVGGIPKFVRVGTGGDVDFTSIKDAIDNILTASSSTPFIVLVHPGLYVEDTITMKQYVSVAGYSANSVIIQVNAVSKDVIVGAPNCEIAHITLTGATNSGKCGIRYSDTSGNSNNTFTARDIIFGHNDTHAIANGSGAGLTSNLFILDSRYGGNNQFNVGFIATGAGGGRGRIKLQNCASHSGMVATLPTDFAIANQPNCEMILNAVQINATGTAGNCIRVTNGGILRASGVNIKGWTRGIWAENTGGNPNILVNACLCENNTQDVVIDHPGTIGSFQGIAEISKIAINPAVTQFSISSTGTSGGTLLVGNFTFGETIDAVVDASELILGDPSMGVYDGGVLSDGGGLTVNVTSGFGYLATTLSPESILKKIDWNSSSIVLSANVTNYIYYNSLSVLSSSASLPDPEMNIVLGRVVTNGTTITLIDASPVNGSHASNKSDAFLREALGAVYSSGTIVTADPSRHLNISSGVYFFSTNRFSPSGGSTVAFETYRQDGTGGFIRATGVTVVDNAKYDDGSGTLQNLTASWFAKHSLYVVGQGANEKYLFVYAQEQYATILEAEEAEIPLPPTFFADGVVLIAGIVVHQGVSTIVEVRDERPVIGFKASGVSAAADHGSLLGLLDDDHPQYLRTDGGRVLTGNLDMGGFQVTNVGNVDGVDVSNHEARHLPNGADPLTTAAAGTISVGDSSAVGVANSFARSDHVHALTAPSAPVNVTKAAASAGSATTVARSDHKHDISTAAAGTIAIGDASADGSASTLARSDHSHALPTPSAPVDVTKAAASAGSATTVARSDHKHDISTAAPGATGLGTTSGEGTATSLARSDHTHQSNTAPANVTKAAAAIGTSGEPARADHKHDISTAVVGTIAIGDSAAEGTATSLARSDHTHALTAPSAPVNVTKAAASAGSATTVARSDHKHDISTGTPGSAAIGDVAAEGTATTVARSDHTHGISSGVPVDVGTSNAAGSATTFARSDHVHNTPFSAVNTALAAATSAISVNSQKITNVTDPSSAQDAATKNYVDTTAPATSSWKQPVRVATTANITLSGTQTIDTISVIAGDRVLVKNQTLGANNGIYVAAAGAWSRATDADTSAKVVSTMTVNVSEGSLNGGSSWDLQTVNPIVLGTTVLTFTGEQLTSTTPADVTKAAAAVGTSAFAARADHKHDISTAIVGTVSVGDSATEGTSTSLARADHTHALTAPAAPVNVTKAAASAGSATTVARSDHKHDISTATPLGIAIGDSATEGTATAVARSDHVHTLTAPSAPADVTKAAASAGSATTVARSDHKHDISTAAPGTISVGDSSTEGTATTVARSDHTHTLTAPAAPANVTKAAASAGSATTVARSDHKHDISTAAPGATGVSTASGEGSATSLARSDHSHQSNTAPSDVTKAAASIGTSGEPARADHKHDISTAAVTSLSATTTNTEGTATSVARSDHTHAIGSAAPSQGIGGSNGVGTATTFARSDHDHTIRETGGPTNLTVAAIADGQFVKRSGTTLVGAAGTGLGNLIQTTWTEISADTTTTSTTFVDLLTQSITTGANSIIITAVVTPSNSNNAKTEFIRVTVDGTTKRAACGVTSKADTATASIVIVYKMSVTAATHTVKIQWRTDANTAQIRPVGHPDEESAFLSIAEVSA